MIKNCMIKNCFIIKKTVPSNYYCNRTITTISKKFSEVPYNEQYESHDFSVKINTDNIPDNLTKPKYISSELNNIINSKYAKHVLKDEMSKVMSKVKNKDKPEITCDNQSPW